MKLLGIEIGAPPEDRGTLGRLLDRNQALRDVFATDPHLARKLLQLQKWQSKRLLRSHADLHANPRYRLAVEFFFNELYGADARTRDSDMIKVQRAMERLLPREGLEALCLAIQLETLSQELDAEVARALPEGGITVARYAQAYRTAGRRADRERQIALTSEIGEYLDGVVRKPMIRGLVRLARGPAHAAGFGLLQEFLERGLDAFEAMHGAKEFLGTVRARERSAMARLFAGVADPFEFDAGESRANRGRNRDECKRPADEQEKQQEGRPQAAAPLAQVPDPGRTGIAAAGGRRAGGRCDESRRRVRVRDPPELAWWQSRSVVMSLAVACVALLVLAGASLWNAARDREAARVAAEREQTLTLRAINSVRALRIAPNPRSWSAAPDATLAWPEPPQLLELHLPVGYAEFLTFAVIIDKVDHGRVLVVERIAPDSNKELLLSVNSSAFGPGEYRLRLQGYTWRGERVDVGWVRLKVTDPR